jgi:hypothetical protein
MEDQSNCAFWQSQINFDDFFLISQGIDALCRSRTELIPFYHAAIGNEEHPLDSRKPAKNLLLKGTQAPASAGACVGIATARLFD